MISFPGRLVPMLVLGLALSACSAPGPTPASSDQPTPAKTPTRIEGTLLFADAGDIYAYTGTEAKALTSTTATEAVPSWSPDGSSVIFTRLDDAGNGDLFTMNADGSDEERLTATAQNEEGAGWAPDGTTIAFSTFGENDGGKIWIMDSDGELTRGLCGAGADGLPGLVTGWSEPPDRHRPGRRMRQHPHRRS